MKNIHYTITFHSYWHCGSGLAAGADVDALVVKDKDGMPYIPGKTIKGLVREAVDEMLTMRDVTEASRGYLSLFGNFDENKGEMHKSESFFTNAGLKEIESIRNQGLQKHLYTSVAQTSIDSESGTAKKHSLRKTEVVVPCDLEGHILNVPDEMVDTVKDALRFIKCLGVGRNRGLGRCTIVGHEKSEDIKSEEAATKTMKFKVELLSDIIINQKAASEGPNKTLDFIPGSNFLGIAASSLYDKLDPQEALYIFHSGHVRFGDAHLAVKRVRSHKVPAAMFHPKLEKASEVLYISHLIPTDEDTNKEMRKAQLKQCRSGFFDFTQNPAIPASVNTNFAIKSAHDIETRTSKEGQMYGYESMSKGSIMYFEVEVDEDKYKVQIANALIGKKRVGRSRSAQYGLVEISQCPYEEVRSRKVSGQKVTIYADSRLIFLDKDTGMPTLRPDAVDLGLEGGQIVWEESQIRTFQYAPWNFTRQCFDTDRCGIEKGSVIVVKDVVDCPAESKYVGYYKNEGFGRVIYNPAFLDGEKGSGIANIKLAEIKKSVDNDIKKYPVGDSSLMRYLMAQHDTEEEEQNILSKVNTWVNRNSRLFKGDTFASQWGTIRSMAARRGESNSLMDLLFNEETGYLKHGVAEEKWADPGKLQALMSFANEFKNDRILRLAIVSLASVMAKECRKEEEK